MSNDDYIREIRSQMIVEAVQAFSDNIKKFPFVVDSVQYIDLDRFNWHPSLRLAIAEEIVNKYFFEGKRPSKIVVTAWKKQSPDWIFKNIPKGEGYMIPGGSDVVNYRGGIQLEFKDGRTYCKFAFTEDEMEIFLNDYVYQAVKTCKSSRYLQSHLDPDFQHQHRWRASLGRLICTEDPWIKDIADYAKEMEKERKNVRYQH